MMHPLGDVSASGTLSGRTTLAVRETLEGRRLGIRAFIPFVGPAVIVSVAYMDPGNFATNIQAGATYGYGLLLGVLLANLVATAFPATFAQNGIFPNPQLPKISLT